MDPNMGYLFSEHDTRAKNHPWWTNLASSVGSQEVACQTKKWPVLIGLHLPEWRLGQGEINLSCRFYLLHASMYIATALSSVCFSSNQKFEHHYLHTLAHIRSEDCPNLVPKVAECSLFNSSAGGFVRSSGWLSHLNLSCCLHYSCDPTREARSGNQG